ncbi:MAG: hypothetical protein IT320_07120 [Anaerolineae bacterium]|nr:hypothetical protein [Anaerolineae bacterium]
MLPMFVPPPESDDDPRARLRMKIAVVLGMLVAFAIGAVLLLVRGGSGGPTWVVLFAIIAVAITMGIITIVQANAQNRHKAKSKAELEDLDNADVYSKMNKFVEDINEAEAEYLQRKLRERGIVQPNDDEAETIDSERRDEQQH